VATSSINPDGTIAIVIQNTTSKEKEFCVWINNKAVKTKSLANSIITMILK